ncbi:hypothetical protein ACQ4PT_022849 [Festuca glaucescens]
MESDLLIRQEEVGAKGDYDVSKRMMEILFWDVMDPNEVVLEPNEVLLKRPAVEGQALIMESDLLIRQEEVGAKGDYDVSKRMMEILFWDVMDLNEVVLEPNEVLLKRPAVEGKLHDPKIVGLSNDLKNQYQQAPPLLKFGMISFKLMDYWRAPDSDVCYVCGQDDHPEQFSPYNYIYGLYDLDTCKGDCLPGQHMMTSMDCGKFLWRVIRLNNMPSSFCTLDLLELFKPSGPLLMCDVPMTEGETPDCAYHRDDDKEDFQKAASAPRGRKTVSC